jgi:CubicO group peptidase (beta-lactamase class C family)
MDLRAGNPDEAGMSAERVRHIVGLAGNWVKEGITPALVILVARRGIILLHEAFGCLTPDPGSPPVQCDTIFPVASLSKPIAATAIMTLVEDGLLSLNRPVTEYIPEFAGEGKHAITVHHLLTHTSGLADRDVVAHVRETKGCEGIHIPNEPPPVTIYNTPSLGYDAPLSKPPGAEMAYCSYGYTLLADIVHRLSGTPYDEFVQAKIFAPLGMKDTFHVRPDPAWSTILYDPSVRHRIVARPADAPCANWLGRSTCRGNSGLLSTVMDMAIFGQMFLNRGTYGDAQVLSPASATEMTRNQIPGVGARFGEEFFPEAIWGYGWNLDGNKRYQGRAALPSSATFSHGGAGGVSLWIDPIYEIVGVFFSVSLWLVPNKSVRSCLDLFMNAVTAAVLAE